MAAQIHTAEVTDDPVRLTAETVVFDKLRDLYEARGSVVVRQGRRTIRADWLVFNNTSGQGVARVSRQNLRLHVASPAGNRAAPGARTFRRH